MANQIENSIWIPVSVLDKNHIKRIKDILKSDRYMISLRKKSGTLISAPRLPKDFYEDGMEIKIWI